MSPGRRRRRRGRTVVHKSQQSEGIQLSHDNLAQGISVGLHLQDRADIEVLLLTPKHRTDCVIDLGLAL